MAPQIRLLRRQELQQTTRVASRIEQKSQQEVLLKNKVAEGHLRRQELQQMTREFAFSVFDCSRLTITI